MGLDSAPPRLAEESLLDGEVDLIKGWARVRVGSRIRVRAKVRLRVRPTQKTGCKGRRHT